MKKVLSLILSFCMLMSMVSVVIAEESGEKKMFDPFEGLDEVSVVTMGGSLTVGGGGNYADDWTHGITDRLLPSLFGDKHKYTLYNMGVGGTHSDYGMFRFQSDIALYEPDLIFIEYCVNDMTMVVNQSNGQYLPENGKRNMEAIIRQCMELPSKPYVILLGLGTSRDHSLQCETYKELAEYYGIGFIDINEWMLNELCADGGPLDYCKACVDKSAEERLKCPYYEYHKACKSCQVNKEIPTEDVSDMSKEEQIEKKYITARQFCDKIDSTHRDYRHTTYYNVTTDGIHPTKDGYMYWSDRINEIISENPEKYFVRPDETKERLYTPETEVRGFVNIKTFDFSEIEKPDSWKESETPLCLIKGFPEFVGFPPSTAYKTYVSEKVGDKITFKFYGPVLYMVTYVRPDQGAIKVTIDGNELTSGSRVFYNEKESRHAWEFARDLTDDWHVAEFENIGHEDKIAAYTPVVMTESLYTEYIPSEIKFNDGEAFKSIKIAQDKKALTFSYDGDSEDITAMLVLKGSDDEIERVLLAEGTDTAIAEDMVVNNGDKVKVYFIKDSEFVYMTEEITVSGI